MLQSAFVNYETVTEKLANDEVLVLEIVKTPGVSALEYGGWTIYENSEVKKAEKHGLETFLTE